MSGLGQPVRRTGDPTAARNVRSSARGYQGDSEADGPRPLCRWTGALLVVLVEPPPISTSDRRAMPILTPVYHFLEHHARTPQMAPGGPARVMGRCEAACLHFPITPLAGNSHDDRKKVCGRDSNPPPYPLPAPFACTDPPTHTLAGLLLFSLGLLTHFPGPQFKFFKCRCGAVRVGGWAGGWAAMR